MDEMKKLFKQLILENSPQCEVFNQNVTSLSEKIISTLSLANTNPEVARQNAENMVIDLYSGKDTLLLKKFSISESEIEVIDTLDQIACIYLVLTLTKNFGINFKEANKQLRKISRASKKLSDELSAVSSKNKVLLAASFTIADINDHIMKRTDTAFEYDVQELQSKFMLSRFFVLEEELKFYSDINKHFNDTFVGKWFQFGARGPKENSALAEWIKSLADLWVRVLKRSLSYSTDINAGREQFLRFAEDCMEPLHPDIIGTDAIRNAFEKLRARGKFDYLQQNSD